MANGKPIKRQIREMRSSAMVNDDSSVSSHQMVWDGDITKRRANFVVYPSIAPKAGKESSTNPADWVNQSQEEAEERGELITVKSRIRAERLAAGSWKTGEDRKEAMSNYRKSKRDGR